MEDYEMKDRTNTANKYRYKRTYNDLTPLGEGVVHRPERRMKFSEGSDISDMRLTFSRLAFNNDIDMTVASGSNNKR
jgi:hypothetical protein